MLDLSGQVVVVTGAAGTIGAGIVRRFSAAGAAVAACTRSSPLSGAVAGLEGRVTAIRADLTDPQGPDAVVEAATTAFGRIDHLVNNAGIQPVVELDEMSDGEWSEMIDTNLTAVHRLTRVVAAAMTEQGRGGSIVHIASIEGIQPAPGHAHYAAAKAGLIMHARAAALAYGAAGIRVNTVSPGLVGGPELEDHWPAGVARWRASAPLHRVGTPEDVGDACLFLCSGLARWISGANLVVDGGVLARPTW
jgi:NAD(P)-dependent dehydrogenase (short-subunit alcohol dehydrogenase family)